MKKKEKNQKTASCLNVQEKKYGFVSRGVDVLFQGRLRGQAKKNVTISFQAAESKKK